MSSTTTNTLNLNSSYLLTVVTRSIEYISSPVSKQPLLLLNKYTYPLSNFWVPKGPIIFCVFFLIVTLDTIFISEIINYFLHRIISFSCCCVYQKEEKLTVSFPPRQSAGRATPHTGGPSRPVGLREKRQGSRRRYLSALGCRVEKGCAT